jgi:hypothetical protein
MTKPLSLGESVRPTLLLRNRMHGMQEKGQNGRRASRLSFTLMHKASL